MVIRGASEHPGANAVEDENGRMVSLSHMPRFVSPIYPSLLQTWEAREQSSRAECRHGGVVEYRDLT